MKKISKNKKSAKKVIKKVAKKKPVKKVVKPSSAKATAGKKVVKKAVKKSAKKSTPSKPVAAKMPQGKKIGVVTHFYGNISVGIVKFSKPMPKGAMITFHGATTNFSQTIDSMQFDHKEIEMAPAGQEIGMKVKKKVREGDDVYAQ